MYVYITTRILYGTSRNDGHLCYHDNQCVPSFLYSAGHAGPLLYHVRQWTSHYLSLIKSLSFSLSVRSLLALIPSAHLHSINGETNHSSQQQSLSFCNCFVEKEIIPHSGGERKRKRERKHTLCITSFFTDPLHRCQTLSVMVWG